MVWIRVIILTLLTLNVFAEDFTQQELNYINFLDLNNDKFISIEELNQSTNIIFQLIDTNNDSKLSIEELKELKNIINLLK